MDTVQLLTRFGLTRQEANLYIPVSYTHLDVYKRQDEHHHDDHSQGSDQKADKLLEGQLRVQPV